MDLNNSISLAEHNPATPTNTNDEDGQYKYDRDLSVQHAIDVLAQLLLTFTGKVYSQYLRTNTAEDTRFARYIVPYNMDTLAC